jgi:hypothetical protein
MPGTFAERVTAALRNLLGAMLEEEGFPATYLPSSHNVARETPPETAISS